MPDVQQLRLPDGRLVVPRDVEGLLARLIAERFAAERRAGRIGSIKGSWLAFAQALEAADFLPDMPSSASGTSTGVAARLEEKGSATVLLSVDMAAGLAGCSTSYLRRELRRGRLSGVKQGRDWLVPQSDFDAWRHGERNTHD